MTKLKLMATCRMYPINSRKGDIFPCSFHLPGIPVLTELSSNPNRLSVHNMVADIGNTETGHMYQEYTGLLQMSRW